MSVFSSLTNRIFFATSLLAVVSIGVAVYRVNSAVTAQAEQELQRGLEEAARLVENYRSMLLEVFRREARLIADLPKLKAAVSTDDPPTVAPIATEYADGLTADLFVVTGRSGRLLASAGAVPVDPARMPPGIAEAGRGRESVYFWPTTRGLLELVSSPIWEPGQPSVLGTLTVGFALDDAVAARLKGLTASDVAFIFDGTVQAATISREHWVELARAAGTAGPARRILGEEEYVAVGRPLLAVSRPLLLQDATVPGASLHRTLVLRSRTERLQVLGRLHAALGVTAAIAVLAAIGLSYALARTVTRPLGVITRAMRDLAASGDLTRRIPEPPATRWDDEDAKLLARTFNTMTASIGRFQREAAQRERLSSLGRLSTVIAHEIRNPLMIIKAAVRPLRRDAAPEQLRKIGADVEEEIARLDRIVSEVLDFARPIRFDLAPADLNAICRDAARAVWAGDAPAGPELQLDPALESCMTDAERVRQALVNVLTNARHAAEGRAGGARVRLSTERRDPVARVLVRDNGPGIPPEALPRVFDPFFTTKRTGSGIGLAITRNIIEGLGGTIAVAASDASGTTFAIELPLATEGTIGA
ncbi:MAG TPA: ATP-binding protein [Vicinamibacterales bacterium]|nr:ATP-binding protein [Vicinamibacterales bacterium]